MKIIKIDSNTRTLSFEGSTKDDQAALKWQSMSPMSRLEIMNIIESKKPNLTPHKKLNACINYLADYAL